MPRWAPITACLRRWDIGAAAGRAPLRALLVQAVVSIATVFAVGAFGYGQTGFEVILRVTAPVFWLFFLLTALSLFVLRIKEPHMERPFRVPGYPFTPLVFCCWCAYMLCGSVIYARWEGLVGLSVLLVGLALLAVSRSMRRCPEPVPRPAVAAAVEEELAAE